MRIYIPIQLGTNSVKKEIVLCENCKGEGVVSEGNVIEMHDCDKVVCPVCHGDRVLIKIKTIVYQRINNSKKYEN